MNDATIASIANRQNGNVRHAQLIRLGLNNDQIRYRVRVGRLFRDYKGVYSVGRPATTWLERAAAAVLACGDGAALSHTSAMALWGFWSPPASATLFHVSVARGRRHRGIKVHRSAGLTGRDLRRYRGCLVTSPARTLLDSAPLLTDKALTRAVNEARISKRVRLKELADIVERFPRHPGARLLKPFVDTNGGPTRSGWEDGFPEFCKQYGLPEPVMNTRVAGYLVDALFVEERVIVELDSWKFHSSRESFEKDRDRDADTLAADHETLRITWERIERRPAREANRLRAILERRRRHAG